MMLSTGKNCSVVHGIYMAKCTVFATIACAEGIRASVRSGYASPDAFQVGGKVGVKVGIRAPRQEYKAVQERNFI
jgi:hypothetical protein